MKPDRVIFNALISACGQSGAVDRAFDVLAEMTTDVRPIDPDHITIGALMKACANAGQVRFVKCTFTDSNIPFSYSTITLNQISHLLHVAHLHEQFTK